MNSIPGDEPEGHDAQQQEARPHEALPDAQPLDLNEGEAASGERLDLDENDRLPWLESADEDYDEGGVDGARVFGFVLAGLAGLAAIVGGIWYVSHRSPDPSLAANGGVIAAPSEPYKEAPKNPGGKTFAGTGDTSFAVSAGQTRPANLAGSGGSTVAGAPTGASVAPAATAPTPKPSLDVGVKPAAAIATAAHAPSAAPAAAAGSVGVQVGAFSSKASAEAAWTRLSGQYAPLKGVSHRVVEGSADIGTVYRLQAVSGTAAAADALCGQLKTSGLACQVKR